MYTVLYLYIHTKRNIYEKINDNAFTEIKSWNGLHADLLYVADYTAGSQN